LAGTTRDEISHRQNFFFGAGFFICHDMDKKAVDSRSFLFRKSFENHMVMFLNGGLDKALRDDYLFEQAMIREVKNTASPGRR